MRIRRRTRNVLLGLVAAIAIALLGLYLLASRVPPEYRPARLSHAEKDVATRHFYRRLMDFSNEGQDSKPFTWSVQERWLNAYLDSMDEISTKGGGKAGSVYRMMQRAGLAEPAVSLDDGAIRLMVQTTEYDKILSIAVRFEFTPAGKLRVILDGAWVGRVPVPTFVVRRQLESLKAALSSRPRRRARSGAADVHGLSADVGDLLARLLAALDGEPISTELTWKLSTRKRVRIERIDIADGVLRLHVVPVGRTASK